MASLIYGRQDLSDLDSVHSEHGQAGSDSEEEDDVDCESLEIFEREDVHHTSLGPGFCTTVMRDALERETHWFMASLNEPRATYNLFLDYVQPQFAPTHSQEEEAIQLQRILAAYWTRQASDFIKQKVSDREHYLARLRLKYGPRST